MERQPARGLIGHESRTATVMRTCIRDGDAVEWRGWRKIPDRTARGGHGFCRRRPPPRLRRWHFCYVLEAASLRLHKSTPLAGSSNYSNQTRRREAPRSQGRNIAGPRRNPIGRGREQAAGRVKGRRKKGGKKPSQSPSSPSRLFISSRFSATASGRCWRRD